MRVEMGDWILKIFPDNKGEQTFQVQAKSAIEKLSHDIQSPIKMVMDNNSRSGGSQLGRPHRQNCPLLASLGEILDNSVEAHNMEPDGRS